VETIILLRYRQALSGRVLDVGCGAGRLLSYLLELGGEVQGIDISSAMVAYCRSLYPAVRTEIGDLRNLRAAVDGQFDAIVAIDNILDVVSASERIGILAEMRELLAPHGLLIFSSHNLDRADAAGSGRALARPASALTKLLNKPPADTARVLRRLPRRWQNRRRLLALEQRTPDHAILNDSEGDYGVLHYYINRDQQQRQLTGLGFELIECLDADGSQVVAGATGSAPWLHYVAHPARTPERGGLAPGEGESVKIWPQGQSAARSSMSGSRP
jgi:SAM-dependent methyltransferase